MAVSETKKAELARDRELRALARRQIAGAIEDDLRGESIMKEVWEECADAREIDVVKAEMRGIISQIRGRTP